MKTPSGPPPGSAMGCAVIVLPAVGSSSGGFVEGEPARVAGVAPAGGVLAAPDVFGGSSAAASVESIRERNRKTVVGHDARSHIALLLGILDPAASDRISSIPLS